MATTEITATGSGRPLPDRPLTYEEFLDWCDEDTWAEWVDGEVQMVSPANLKHQDVSGFLNAVIREWTEAHGLGQVLPPPFQMRLREPVRRGREPDLLFMTNDGMARMQPTYLDGPADLVVEIVSPESISRDRGEKFVEYEQAGVLEYWLIDPERQQAEFYQRGPEGHYRLVLGGAEGTYTSVALIGFQLPVEWLWRDPLPKLAEARRALGLGG